jgi:glyoxylase-like metal-dependent hydrolase (beta-lactamase superfamily II)
MQFGEYRVEIIPDTEFRLDGGAMFGVVPRVVWERVCPPDEKNRIRLNMNCVFIDTGKERILIETGIGEKWSAKEIEMYSIFREKPLSETLFERTGSRPEDITIVVNTHLHFDHAGGNTILSEPLASAAGPLSEPPVLAAGQFEGEHSTNWPPANAGDSDLVPQFPHARYLVSKNEFDHAENPHERDRASYLPENWRPLQESGQLELMPDDYDVVPGLKMQTVRGHSETMQTWRLDGAGATLHGFADLVPTRHHLPLAWNMGYDLYPMETLEFKRRTLPQAVAEGWACLFYHDHEPEFCRIVEADGRMKASPLNDYV